MQPQFEWKNHLFSHSIKSINRSLPSTQHSQLFLQKLQPSARKHSPTDNTSSQKRSLWVQSRRKYEQMIDDIIRKHVQEEQMDLKMTKVFIKHSYKNYRIQQGQNPEPSSHLPTTRQHHQTKKINQARQRSGKRVKTSNLDSQQRSYSLKKIQKGGQLGVKLPSLASSPKGNQLDAFREASDFIKIELKLRKLKEQASLDQINEFHKKISRKYIKTESGIV